MAAAKYKRVLLKLGGEALAGADGSGISPAAFGLQGGNFTRLDGSVKWHGMGDLDEYYIRSTTAQTIQGFLPNDMW